MICPFCNKEAIWCENKEIYGKNYGKSYMCWLCKPCKAYVSCHNNTKNPQGTMATAELREWRKKVHKHIDPLWTSGFMDRNKLYSILSKKMGKTYHTGNTTIEDCKTVLSFDLSVLTGKK